MNALKRVDFYRKYTNEDRVSTLLGACFSLLTMLIILTLCGLELSIYMYPHLNREVVIDRTPPTQENTLPMNVKIAFPKVPCNCNFATP